MSIGQWLPLAAILAPLIGAAWIRVVGPGRRAGAAVAIGAVVVAFAGCTVLAVVAGRGASPALALIALVPPIHLTLRVDALGALFGLTVAALYVPATLHAVSWLRDDAHWRLYHTVALACQALILLVAFAGNLVTLLVGYELFSLVSFLLIVHRRTPDAFRAGIKYLAYVIPGAALTLIGTVIVFFAAGSVGFTPGGLAAPAGSAGMLTVAWVCLVFGFGVKAALFPLHGWIPDAHPAAPAPFSGILSGVMVATGAFAIVRVAYEIFGPVRLEALGVMPWLAIPAALGVVVAGVLAVGEDHLKRRLAWSTISQMGYATLAASLLEPRALAGALVHLANHAFIKGGLFFAVGAVAAVAGIHRVSELPGLSRRMPVTAVVITVLAAALVGLPPLAGFIGKWWLVTGAAGAGAWPVLAVLLLGSVLAALYLWPVVFAAWSAPPESRSGCPVGRDEPWNGMLAAALVTAVLAVVFGVAAAATGYPLGLAVRAAAVLAGGS